MATGREIEVQQETGRDGRVDTRVVPLVRVDPEPIHDELFDLRVHVTLWGSYQAGHPYRIVAGQAIDLDLGTFEKYAIQNLSAVVGKVGIGRRAATEPGGYDALIPGNSELEERVVPTTVLSILFDVVPADPIEVTLYAGEPAKPV